jgi:hypothetical protein
MKKTMLKISGLATIAITGVVLVVSSCSKPETVVSPPVPGNEFLTTVAFRCINTAAPFDTTTAIWRNLNPNGTQAPDTSEAILNFKKNSTYVCNVYIFDESKTTNFGTTNLGATVQPNFNINNLPSTTVNVTTEIRQRQNYHLVCFTPTGGISTNISVVRTDYDTNTPSLQVGLNDNVTTINASTGRMEVALHHQPNVKNGSCSPGSDDFDIFYGVTIQ